MIELEPLLQEITALTPIAVALAGLVVGIAPSSFPLITVAAGLAAGQGAAESGGRRIEGLWLSVGVVLSRAVRAREVIWVGCFGRMVAGRGFEPLTFRL